MSIPEPLGAHVVTTLYQSQPEAATFEEGYEVQVATLPSGATHSVVLYDHTGANMVEMPPEVALAIGGVLTGRLRFEGEKARLDPPISFDPANPDWQVVTLYLSDDHPGMYEAGYELRAAVSPGSIVEGIALHDHIGKDRLEMPAPIARSIALAMTAFPLFPPSTLN